MASKYQEYLFLGFEYLTKSYNFKTYSNPENMKRFLLLTLGMALLVPAYSQNYQTVNSSEIKLFSSINLGSIRGHRIDSVIVVGVDSLIYPSRTIQLHDGSYCYNPMGPSMLGDHIRVMPDGTNLFFNLNGDTIRINTNAHAGDIWKIWSGANFDIYGEMLETELGDVFGLADSIKSIKINAFDNEMNPVESFYYNDYSISIAKNHGLVSTFNFVAFPNLHEEYFYMQTTYFELYGIESEALGEKNLTTFDFFDFQPGDIIEFETEYVQPSQQTYRHVREEYISRQDYPDSIVYVINSKIRTSGSNMEVSIETSQISRTIEPIAFLDGLPGLPLESNFEENTFFSVTMNKDYFLQKNNLSFNETHVVYSVSEDCYFLFYESPCIGSSTGSSYYKGLGGPYYSCGDAYPFLTGKYLSYFSKDSVEWGTPYDFTQSLEVVGNDNFFEIYPNPANDKINLKVNKATLPLKAEVFDLIGRSVLNTEIKAERPEIDISILPKGVYFFHISFSGNGAAQKFIVE